MPKNQTIEFSNFQWIDIKNPDEKDIESLRQQYNFHPLDLADCLTTSHRSKIDVYDDYIFMVFIFPLYNRETREIESTEINFFISKKYIITIHREGLEEFNKITKLFKLSPSLKDDYLDKSPERLLYEILNKLLHYVIPMVDHLNDDCDGIEKLIFSGKEKKMISEILIIRRNITDFRKIMQVHKNVIKKAITNLKANDLFVMKKTDIYFESLVDLAKEIWETLENLKERIEALQQTNESQISFRLSDIMKILTIISVITFPITVLAATFGMNTVTSMPFVNSPYDFWYVIGIMSCMVILMLVIFRKKGWF